MPESLSGLAEFRTTFSLLPPMSLLGLGVSHLLSEAKSRVELPIIGTDPSLFFLPTDVPDSTPEGPAGSGAQRERDDSSRRKHKTHIVDDVFE